MGFMDEYYKAMQEPNQHSGSTSHAVSNTRSSYLDEYNKVITNAVVRTTPGQLPSFGKIGWVNPTVSTLPFRPGTDNNTLTTLPFRPGNDNATFERLPYTTNKKTGEQIRSTFDLAPPSIGQKKDTTKEEEEEKKWYQKGHFEDGWDFGDITKTILGIDEDTASLKDLTVNSLKRGYYNSIYGEESYEAMLGNPNKKEAYKKLLESDEYQFAPGNDLASGLSGAMEMIGQQARQFMHPRTLAFTGSAVGAAIIAGNAGPQALVPEEIISVPAVASAAFKASSAASNFEIEAGHAYNEMLELGISEDTAKKVAMAVGAGNAGLELLQVDELVDAFKATNASGATKSVSKLIVDELVKRGIDVGTETLQEDLQEGITIAGVQAASKKDKGEYAYSAEEVKDRLWDTTKSSALSFGLMNVPATAKNTYSIVKDNKNALNQNQTVQNEEHPIVEQIPKVEQDIQPEVEEVQPIKQTEVAPAEPQKRTLYTGSPNTDIKQFKVGGVDGSKQTGDRYGRGVYLTTNESTAKNYAGDKGRVYQINADDLNIFDLNDTITPEMRDSLISAFKGGDTQFRNSMLRNFRTEMTFNDFESAEAFFNHQRKVWKEQDGEYSANKPEIIEADNETGKAVIEFTDFENWENNIGTLTGNHLYDALKSLSTDDFSSFITGHGFDGIAFDEDSENQQYVIYRNEDRLHIDDGSETQQASTNQEIAPAVKESMTTDEAPATEEFSAPEVAISESETTTDKTGLQWLYDKRQSLNDILMARYQEGLYNEETENLARQWQIVNNEIADLEAHQKQEEIFTQPVAQPDSQERELTTTEKVQKHLRDEVLVFDKLFDSDTPENVAKFEAVSKATEHAQDFISKGAEGVNGIPQIFGRISENGDLDDFESYLRHLLNVDRSTVGQRFGTPDRAVFGDFTAEESQKIADELEETHPEFKQAADEVYSFNNYLLDLRVRAGRVTQEWADRWKEMYPHYVPISRSRHGDTQAYTQLLNVIQGKPLDTSDSGAVDSFLGDVDEAAKVHEITSSGHDFNPLIDTMVNQAFTVYWDLAANHPDYAVAPVSTDVHSNVAPMTDNFNTEAQNELSQDKSTSQEELPKINSANPSAFDSDSVMKHGKNNPWKFFKEFVLDNGMVFENVAKKSDNRQLEADWNFIRNAHSVAQHLIGHGSEDHGVRSLKSIHADAQKGGSYADFKDYLGYLRNIDGMTMQSRFGLAQNHNYMGRDVSAGKSYKEVRRLEKAHPEFKQLAQDCFDYCNYLRNQMVEHGMITQEDADLWSELYPHYVPMQEGKGMSGDHLESMAKFTLHVQRAIALNDFGVNLKNTLRTDVGSDFVNIDSFIRRLDVGSDLFLLDNSGERPTFTIYENGERVAFEITDEMYVALKPTADFLSYSIPVVSDISTLRRNLITAYSPWFTLKNAVKDIQEVMINSQHPLETYATLKTAVSEIHTKGEWYQEYIANGGDQNTYFDMKNTEFGEGKGVTNWVETKTPLKRILDANNVVEMTPRLAEYIASRQDGRSIEVSMLDAARVTTNFQAGGKLTKFLNRNGCTFLNASVQGAVQQVRNINEAAHNGAKGWASLAARYVVAGLPALLLNNLIWEDDEEYKELPDYITNNYYIVWKYGDGKFVRIPKGRTSAVIQNAIKQVARQSSGDDEADWIEFFKIFAENIAPNNPLEDNILAPIIQVAKNETWYDEDLVPSRLQKIDEVTERFDEKTDSASIWLSEKLQDIPGLRDLNLNPKQINYLLDQYSGVLGDTVLPFFTPKAESPNDSFLGKAVAPLRDIFTTDSVLNNRVTGEFYDTLEAAEAQADSENATMTDKLRSGILISANVEISELMKEQRKLQTSDLPDSEKYHRNRELKEEINTLQRDALDSLKSVFQDGIYAEAGDKRYNYSEEDDTWWEVKPELANGKPNPYYIQEQLSHDKLGMSYADFWNGKKPPEDFEGKTYYGEFNGKRYNYDVDDNSWYEIKPKTKDGEDNYFYQQEQIAHDKLGVSYEDFWNNREAYIDANYVADRWGEPFYETAKNVFGAEHFAEIASGMSDISADKNANGDPISGSRKRKMQEYVYGLDIPDVEKHILYKSQYSYTNNHNYEIIEYLNNRDDISYEEMESVLKELGFRVDSNGNITW